MSLLFDVIKTVKGKDIAKVSANEHNIRKRICQSCPQLMRTGNCKICGCFIIDKTKYAQEHCPIKKW